MYVDLFRCSLVLRPENAFFWSWFKQMNIQMYFLNMLRAFTKKTYYEPTMNSDPLFIEPFLTERFNFLFVSRYYKGIVELKGQTCDYFLPWLFCQSSFYFILILWWSILNLKFRMIIIFFDKIFHRIGSCLRKDSLVISGERAKEFIDEKRKESPLIFQSLIFHIKFE